MDHSRDAQRSLKPNPKGPMMEDVIVSRELTMARGDGDLAVQLQIDQPFDSI